MLLKLYFTQEIQTFAPKEFDSYISVFTNKDASGETHHIVVGLLPLDEIKLVKISVLIRNFDAPIVTNLVIADIIQKYLGNHYM